MHSHAFHRALRGRTQMGHGTFWTWREQMYAAAAHLDPDSYRELATAVFAEMALAGITAVGEFHYLHHSPKGGTYADPNAMGAALVEAAAAAGIRITLLDTCYLAGGFDTELNEVQRRFSDGDAERWAERVDQLRKSLAGSGHARIGAAVHSVRAVPVDQLAPVVGFAAGHELPLHVHLSEQRAENDACLARHHRTPTQLLADHGALGPRTTAVHATHLSQMDIDLLGTSATAVCMCPTTERDLADGIGPARTVLGAGSPVNLGSDSHAVIDLFEEARAVELDERLRTERRGHWRAEELLHAATAAGHAALGWPEAGRLEPGALADFTTVALDTVRLAGAAQGHAAESVVFAATAADVRHVVVGGRFSVRDHRHETVQDVPGAAGRGDQRHLRRDTSRARPAHTITEPPGSTVVTTLVTNIGELVTHAPHGTFGEAAFVVEDGRIAWVGDAAVAPEADERIDVGGRAVVPGFVDSHAHLVFAGDRAAEFEARMAGAPYTAGGIRTTVAATRAASDQDLRTNLRRLIEEMLRQGTTTVECKSGYGLTPEHEARALRLAREQADAVTFLGAHVVPPEYQDDADGYVDLVKRRDARRLRAARRLRRRVLRARGLRRRPGPRDPDRRRAKGLDLRLHANQLGYGPGGAAGGRARRGLGGPLHVPRRPGRAGARRVGHGRDAAARRGVLHAVALPAGAAAAGGRGDGRDRDGLQPRVLLHRLDAVLHRAGGAGNADVAGRGAARGDRRRGQGAAADGRRAPRRGARADFAMLDAPSYVHLAYRPGVPLVRKVWKDGKRVV